MGVKPDSASLEPSRREFRGRLAGVGYSEEGTGMTLQLRPVFSMIIFARDKRQRQGGRFSVSFLLTLVDKPDKIKHKKEQHTPTRKEG